MFLRGECWSSDPIRGAKVTHSIAETHGSTGGACRDRFARSKLGSFRFFTHRNH